MTNNKNTHFITIVSPTNNPESVSISIDLSKEEYELINRIGVLFEATADITQPVLTISRAIVDSNAETVADLQVNPQTKEGIQLKKKTTDEK